MRLSPKEFAERFAGVDITQEDIRRAVQIDLVELDGGELSVPNECSIDLRAAVARMGVPVSEILDEHEALMISVRGIAERFREVFKRHFREPFVRMGMPAEEMPSLTAAVNQLAELATSVVTGELHERFAAFAEHYLARVPESVTKDTTANNPPSAREPAVPVTGTGNTSQHHQRLAATVHDGYASNAVPDAPRRPIPLLQAAYGRGHFGERDSIHGGATLSIARAAGLY